MITLHGIQKEYKNPETDGVRAYIHDLRKSQSVKTSFDYKCEYTQKDNIFLQCDAIPFKCTKGITGKHCDTLKHNYVNTDTLPENSVVYIEPLVSVIESDLSHIQTTTIPYYTNCVVYRGTRIDTTIVVDNVLVFYNSTEKSYSVLIIPKNYNGITPAHCGKTGNELLSLPNNSRNPDIARVATGTLQYCGVSVLFNEPNTVLLPLLFNPCCKYINEYDFLKCILSDKESVTEKVFSSILDMVTSSDRSTVLMGLSMLAEYNYPATPALTLEIYWKSIANWVPYRLKTNKKTEIMYKYIQYLKTIKYTCTKEEYRLLEDIVYNRVLEKQKSMLEIFSQKYPYIKITLGDFKVEYTGNNYLEKCRQAEH